VGRVLLIDDHPLFRSALRVVVRKVQANLTVVEAETFGRARDILQQDPEVALILLDLNLPDSQGLNGLLSLGSKYPQIPVAIVSSNADTGTVRRALALGAAGFIPKSSSVPEIIAALRAILAGEMSAPEAALTEPVPEAIETIALLSPAQLRILFGLQRGLRNKQIAYEMGVTERTVKAYMTAMFRKLHVTSRTQAVIAAQTLLKSDPIS
jgi:DNA-binding NarL/FixJ family response regulator